ncbi:MAG: glucose-1-phosphate thymidylyltransferase [Candidatus Magasanikbacteria bacterium]|nr:glucose-1-phosphate thymidylyltransferase [Candidatus Magasanikbacteria bacterium]
MKIRKAILTGGGRATRLYPITTTINKHLIPLANKPMIFHAIEKVVEAGVTEIFINVNPGETQLPDYVGDGGHWGIKIKFFEQTGGPQGIAHVVHEARNFIGDDPFIFYLSDNILLGSLKEMVHEFEHERYDCLLALSKVADPERFGVPFFNEKNELVDIVEKPANPQNNFAVTGLYIYGPKIFFETFPRIQKSARGEYEISAIHSHFLKAGKRVGYKEITGWWKDTGKSDDLLLANKLLLDALPDADFSGRDAPAGVEVAGRVRVCHGARCRDRVTLRGPGILGENCDLEDCAIGPYVTIGAGATIRGATIDHSMIFENTRIDSRMHFSQSLIGKSVTIRINGRVNDGPYHLIVGDKSVIEHS